MRISTSKNYKKMDIDAALLRDLIRKLPINFTKQLLATNIEKLEEKLTTKITNKLHELLPEYKDVTSYGYTYHTDESDDKHDWNTVSLYFKFEDLWSVDFSYWIDSSNVRRIQIAHYMPRALADFSDWNELQVTVHIYPCSYLETMNEKDKHRFYRAVQFIQSFTNLSLNFTTRITYTVETSIFKELTQNKPVNILYAYFTQLYDSYYKYPYNYAVKEAIYTICAIYKFRNSSLPLQKDVFRGIVQMIWNSRYEPIWKGVATALLKTIDNAIQDPKKDE